MRSVQIAAAAALLVASLSARAAENPASDAPVPPDAGATVDEVVRLALEANPGIRAARAAVDAAKARSGVETGYADPAFTATWLPQEASADKQASTELMLTQVLPFPGKTKALRQVGDAEEALARIALERSIREVTLRVRESAVEICYLRRAREIAAGNREQLAQPAGRRLKRLRSRTGPDSMTCCAPSPRSHRPGSTGNCCSELEQTEIARLNSLLSRDPRHARRPHRPARRTTADRGAPGDHRDLPPPERREVLLAREEGNRARAEGQVADLEARPEFMLGVGLMQESALAEMDASSRLEFQFGMTLPFFTGKNASRRAEAAAGVARAEAMEREAADEARAAVREIYFRLRNAERLVRSVPRRAAAAGLRVAAARRDLAPGRGRQLRRSRRRGDPLVLLPGRAGPGRRGPREVPRAPRSPRGASAHGAAGGRRSGSRCDRRAIRRGRPSWPAWRAIAPASSGMARRGCFRPAPRAPSRWPPPRTTTPRSPTRSFPKSRSAISSCSR